MKNIHIIPTDKPSRLAYDFDEKCYYLQDNVVFFEHQDLIENRNIYITNSEEIKEGDDFIHYSHGKATLLKADKVRENIILDNDNLQCWTEYSHKVVLCTDPELIKNGVQEVPEYFLKWFIVGKNPIEYVEIKPHLESLDTMKNSYEIIIPQPKQEINIDDVAISSKQIFTLKQETIDDARKNYISDINCELYNEQTNETIKSFASDAFEQGAEWYYKKTLEMFTKLVVRSCFKSDRDYKVAKQTLLEITGIDYENEVDKNTNTRNR